MAAPAAVEVRNALDELVNQFADPMSFLRELVQNSIDAGTEEIEVRVERQSGRGEAGVTVINIDDWGEGMTREIIEKRLTRLFSSAKDGDMTKIGKFGIGFVSVFAIEPDAVCIDTAREGETWRILFGKDRRFKLIRRDEAIEGTKIQILKNTTKAEHGDLVRRAKEVLTYWCRHVETEIRFGDEPIRKPFALPNAGICVEHDDGFSHVVVGHRAGQQSFAGFYNAGLTLIETEDGSLPGIAYKVSSPHLEHTLTRDNIIEDQGYERVMAQVRAQVAGPLCDAVLSSLAEVFGDGDGDTGGQAAAQRRPAAAVVTALARHAARGDLVDARRDAVVARSPAGAPLTVATLVGRHKDDQILVARQRSVLTDALERDGRTVVDERVHDDGAGQTSDDAATDPTDVAQRPHGAVPHLLATLAPDAAIVAAARHYCCPVMAPTPPAGSKALAAAVKTALANQGANVGDVEFGDFRYPESVIAERIAIAQRRPGQVSRVEEITELTRGLLSRERCIVVNLGHPCVGSLIQLAQSEPEFAGYVLVKHFFLGGRLDSVVDSALLAQAVEARWRRSTS